MSFIINPYRFASSFSGALDNYTTSLSGVWSVRRRMLSSYTGSLIRVRRSSDNTEQDIGYTSNGSLDTTALLSFVGSGDGFVKTLYDQQGSNNYAQAASGSQPLIVSSGTLQTDNGSTPAIRLNNSRYLQASAWTGSSMSLYVRQRVFADPPSSVGAIISGLSSESWSSVNRDHFPFSDSNVYLSYSSTTRKSCGNPTADLTAAHSFTCVSATNNWLLRINSASFFSTATNATNFNGIPWIGRASIFYADGWFCEMAWYDAAHSSTQWTNIEPIFQP